MSSLEVVEDVVVGSCDKCGRFGRVIVKFSCGKPSFKLCVSCYREKLTNGGLL